MKETKIEELFANYQPDLGDSNAYMDNLSKKLAAVEYIKQYHDEEVRRSRRTMVAMFVSGTVTGFCSILLLLLFPQVMQPIVAWFANLSPNLPPMLPKMLFILCLCFISLCITSFVGRISENPPHEVARS
ncbi:MAG: hypothetical protein K6A41_00585 [Bacteroidales bacterium]|nr:hypothetical protein [Bacteroidales bacterium]